MWLLGSDDVPVSGLLAKVVSYLESSDFPIKIEYKEFLVYYIIQLLIHRKECNFQLEGSWNALRKYYGRKPYAYYYLIKRLFRNLIQFSLGVIKHH